MTNGKLNYEDTVQGIESYFPHELKNDTRTAFENCKHVDHMDGCEAAYLLTSCLLKEHPKLFFP